jgi:integrase
VIRVIDSIAEESRRGEGAPVLADRVKAIISSMYRWAQREDRLEHNPAQLIDNRAPGRWRDRILADCEIPAFWIGLDSAPVEPSMRYIFRLLLLLGQRRTEVCGALVSEFDLISDVRVWTIGRDRTKNGRTHSIPLPDMAAHFWREAIEQFSDGLHVFPGRDTGGPIDGSSVTRAMRRTREALALQDLTVHDLRRTVRSRMAGIGIRREHSAAALNHIDELHVGVHDEAYNRYNYMVEKLGALRLWETELTRLLAGAEPG